MSGDGSTLPEGLGEALVRAAFQRDESSAALVTASLASPDPRARVLALRAAHRRGLLTAPRWRAALADADAVVRREGFGLVAHEPPDPALAADVRTGLDDADALVVEAAAFALGERRDRTAVDDLSRVARHHDDARARESAVAALGAIGDERGLAAV
ncbi:MAG TPA: HEAT repeat domain-containing protein, partial [Acidimicrobiales bacterium]|nr:HEAT repeat domain-containing protein [Acidimicrobiales bacterium]